jgi:CO/xanthine dehydrogenase FAD-binding subunit
VGLYAKPKTIDEATALLAQGRWRILSGGTDFYPAQGTRPIRDDVLDLNGLEVLRGICETATHHVIGARTTWSDIARASLPPAFDSLRQAAIEVGSSQIQNVGTIAGNICNASPAADGVPPLLVLGAEVELRSAAGQRHVPLAGFITGNRRTLREPGELVTAIRIPKESAAGASAFVKLGSRRHLVISIVMVAARIERDATGTVRSVGVAVGSCSAVAHRLAGLENALVGWPADAGAIEAAVDACDLSVLTPIDDIRASASYRSEAARELVRRALLNALGSATPSAEQAAA